MKIWLLLFFSTNIVFAEKLYDRFYSVSPNNTKVICAISAYQDDITIVDISDHRPLQIINGNNVKHILFVNENEYLIGYDARTYFLASLPGKTKKVKNITIIMVITLNNRIGLNSCLCYVPIIKQNDILLISYVKIWQPFRKDPARNFDTLWV